MSYTNLINFATAVLGNENPETPWAHRSKTEKEAAATEFVALMTAAESKPLPKQE